MFGNMFGDMETKQEEIKKHLATVIVEADAGDGAVKVSANANRVLQNIAIDRSKLEWDDTEQVEDLILVAVNNALELAAAKEAEETQKLLKELLPPGFGNLFGG
ncbi:MAG: YbaB/EbfC family nucleoid-associated protein [Bacteroidota bacterium]